MAACVCVCACWAIHYRNIYIILYINSDCGYEGLYPYLCIHGCIKSSRPLGSLSRRSESEHILLDLLILNPCKTFIDKMATECCSRRKPATTANYHCQSRKTTYQFEWHSFILSTHDWTLPFPHNRFWLGSFFFCQSLYRIERRPNVFNVVLLNGESHVVYALHDDSLKYTHSPHSTVL